MVISTNSIRIWICVVCLMVRGNCDEQQNATTRVTHDTSETVTPETSTGISLTETDSSPINTTTTSTTITTVPTTLDTSETVTPETSTDTNETDTPETSTGISLTETDSSPITTITTVQTTLDTDHDTIITASEETSTTVSTVASTVKGTTDLTTEGGGTEATTVGENVCFLDPCRNGGTCIEDDTKTKFHCVCPAGYVGIRCEVKDFCVEGEGGQLCEDGACVYSADGSSRRCSCFVNMFWDSKQKKCRAEDLPCFPNPCMNNGTCSSEGVSMKCECKSGYEGKNCSIINKCGTCKRGSCLLDEETSTKYCRCEDGLYWNSKKQECDEITSPCLPEPCENGGTCAAWTDEYYNCSCAKGFSGMTCEVIDKCTEDEDCGGHGTCHLSEDKTTRICKCEKGYYLEEKSQICEGIIKPCIPNPCFHDGICTRVSDEKYKCTCSAGYKGARCAVRDMCKMDGGKAFCTGANCTDMHELDTYICECEAGKYFDYSKRKCSDLNMCTLVTCKDTEKCEAGTCRCQDHWKPDNSSDTCKPNICSTHPCPLPEMVCKEGSGANDYSCSCKEGSAFNGTHCNVATCAFPSLNHCDQQCKTSADGGVECGCLDGFHLQADNKTCLYNGTTTCSNKTCDQGSCVVDDGEEICVCPNGYVEVDGNCTDICSTGKLADGVCPMNQCEAVSGKAFRCKCEGKYALAGDGTTCTAKSVCVKNGIGWKDCNGRNAMCVPDWETDTGFRCVCPDYLVETSEGKCDDICNIETNQLSCSSKGAKCDVDTAGKMHCKCPPYFRKNKDGVCNKAADVSFLVTLPLDPTVYQQGTSRKKRSLDTPLDHRKIQEDVTLAAKNLFSGFTEANILACSSKPSFTLCKIEMQFTTVQGLDLRRLQSDKSCLGEEGSPQCLMPPSLVLVKDEIGRNVQVQRTDPCDQDIHEEVCGSETTCMSSPNSRHFNCSCKPGFAVRGKTYLFDDTMSFIEICKDIDECKYGGSCPEHSLCRNTIGSFACSCEPGYRSQWNNEGEQCVGICSPNPCTHGKCSKRGEHEFDCTCEAGYRGSLCDLEDKNFKRARNNSIIVGVVLGGILLISVILFVACYTRLKKQKHLDDPNNVLYNSAEMTERRPVGGGTVNNAFQRE